MSLAVFDNLFWSYQIIKIELWGGGRWGDWKQRSAHTHTHTMNWQCVLYTNDNNTEKSLLSCMISELKTINSLLLFTQLGFCCLFYVLYSMDIECFSFPLPDGMVYPKCIHIIFHISYFSIHLNMILCGRSGCNAYCAFT